MHQRRRSLPGFKYPQPSQFPYGRAVTKQVAKKRHPSDAFNCLPGSICRTNKGHRCLFQYLQRGSRLRLLKVLDCASLTCLPRILPHLGLGHSPPNHCPLSHALDALTIVHNRPVVHSSVQQQHNKGRRDALSSTAEIHYPTHHPTDYHSAAPPPYMPRTSDNRAPSAADRHSQAPPTPAKRHLHTSPNASAHHATTCAFRLGTDFQS